MKKTFILLFAILIKNTVSCQTFDVDTLQYNGDINKYINIVIMGDGYTAAEQTKFINDADTMTRHLFGQSPWKNYSDYFNVFAIKVISLESGIKHPNTAVDCNSGSPLVPVSNPSTYFGCSFDSYGIHRLVVPQNFSGIAAVLAANFPLYDQVLIIANSPYYGGSGGAYATSTTGLKSNEITAHELGHSFAFLADEYYAGDVYASEKVNMTKETDPLQVKWKNWMGYNSTGIYQHCCVGNSALWYKPSTRCKMQSLDSAYCSVCTQAIIERIHQIVNPIVSYTPVAKTIDSLSQLLNFRLTGLMLPAPNTLNIKWKFDGTLILTDVDSFQIKPDTLQNGTHTLTATVTDTSSMLRVDNHSAIHLNSVSWTINKINTGLKLYTADNSFRFAVYPNPAVNTVNISIEQRQSSNVSIDLISYDGKVMRHNDLKNPEPGLIHNAMNIENLPKGTYFIVFKIGEFIHTETLIKL